ncbi:MAG: glutamate--tRNA ligase [Bacilli bacterium]|nr:glutamate--tRNA ligase [Bacilli bacterium]
MDKVRVRYAPSPTGFLHIGGARSALFNYLYAKRYNGDFVFRIEDTDIERNVKGGEESQYNDLLWLGIVPDESPSKPVAKYAPYRQMERLDMYHKYAQELIDKGYAYYCYCNEEELEESRNLQLENGIAAPQYDGHCLHLSEDQIEQYKKEGRKPCIRLKMPKNHIVEFDDLVRGKVSFNTNDIGDWVIVKSNGIPTYNFAVVIDDHSMEMTHVFRGEEHLSNTPKQIVLYEYFGWEVPRFGHMTIIVNENGKKLSKRDNNILQFMSQYRDLGYIPEAIVNFILLLGWTPEENREFFTIEEAAKEFSSERLSSSPSMFDCTKLMWMNNHYIRELDDAKFLQFIKPFVQKVNGCDNMKDEDILFVANLYKEQLRYGQEIVDLLNPIFNPGTCEEQEALDVMALDTTPNVIKAFANEISSLSVIDADTVKSAFKNVQASLGVKGKSLYMPVRLKLTGSMHGAEMVNIIKVLGKEETIKRLMK